VRVQVLSSGSQGNSTLVRAGECTLLVDAGLPPRAMRERLAAARLSPFALDHVLVSHGHLDHARSAGIVAKSHGAWLHCAERLMRSRRLARAPRRSVLPIGRGFELSGRRGRDRVEVLAVPIPHDAHPTVAFRIQHEERVAVIATDMGRPCGRTAQLLRGAHLIVLEFNHDVDMLEYGPYPEKLQRRIRGGEGHLSNAQAAQVLRQIAGKELHTLVLAHLSEHNNTPELAYACARNALSALDLDHVRVHIASQCAVGENLPA
jgi:phosphoribosyl 1,2-cyclic phosphodiesterase